MKTVDVPSTVLLQRRQLITSTPFLGTTASGFTFTAASGTIAALAEAGGGMSLLTQAADNAIASWTTQAACLVLAAEKPIHYATLIRTAEVGANVSNLLFGLHSGAVASALGNDGAGPPASYSGFSFFKVDGGTHWNIEASVAGAQTTVQLTADNSFTGAAVLSLQTVDQFLEIDVYPKTAVLCDVTFKINGILVYKLTDFVYTSIAAMAAVGAVKAGSADAETLKTRFCTIGQVR